MPPERSSFAVPLTLLLIASTFTAAAVLEPGPMALGPTDTERAVAADGAGSPHSVNTTTVDGADGVPIEVTIFRPDGATEDDPVPMILHGHGWGGEGWDEINQSKAYLDAEYGVASIDQRGHGDSGGQARVMSPDHEAEDVQAVVDHVAGLDWVKEDGPNDPVLGAIGGSYGGGYQLVTALDEVDERDGDTRFDALAPDITWFDLARSLAPNQVVKSEWVDLLVGVAKAPPVTDTHPELVDKPYAYTLATGDLPSGDTPAFRDINAEYRERSPVGFVEDKNVQLDIPVLLTQGMTDTLFPLDQAVANYERTLTSEARSDSYVVGHTTGHVLPSAGPPAGHLQAPAGGATPCADAIAGGQTQLLIEWFNHTLRGEGAGPFLDDSFVLPTEPDDGGCISVDSLPEADTAAPAESPSVTVSGPAGPPNMVALDADVDRIVGSPSLEASVTSGSLDTRFFVALAVGPSPAQAHVVDSQWRPVRLEGPVTGKDVTVDLPDVVADLEEDEEVYLATATTLDMYAHHGSRTPGPVTLEDVEVELPTLPSAS